MGMIGIGALVVFIADLFVDWPHPAWPDIVIAFATAGLFLQSAWVIIRVARSDLPVA